MIVLQFTGSVISFLLGGFFFLISSTVIHQALASIFLLISAVLFAGGAITSTLTQTQDNLAWMYQQLSKRISSIYEEIRPNEVEDQETPSPVVYKNWVDEAKSDLKRGS